MATRILFGRVVTCVVEGCEGREAAWSLRESILFRGRERLTAFMKGPVEVCPTITAG